MGLVSALALPISQLSVHQKRKRSKSQKSNIAMKTRRSAWKNKREKEKEVDLRVLPPNVMRGIVEKMSVEDHMGFRAVCKYAHDEIEAYWRSQKSISIPQLRTWFPHLHEESWRLESISCLLDELSVVFNLFKPGNVRKFSLRGVTSVDVKSLVRCVEMATGKPAGAFFENVGEFDMRGCHIAPDHLKLLDELFPNLHTIILHHNAIIVPKRKIRNSPKHKTEVTHHVTISSTALKTEIQNVPQTDVQVMWFVREYLPDVRHVFIDLDC